MLSYHHLWKLIRDRVRVAQLLILYFDKCYISLDQFRYTKSYISQFEYRIEHLGILNIPYCESAAAAAAAWLFAADAA